jgi:threonine/homoserine/homoserine lactone efflux protein
MLVLFSSAYMGAIVSTVPVGPINIALIALAIRPQKANWYAAVVGVIFIDALFAVLTYSLAEADALHLKDYLPAHSRIIGELVMLLMILTGIVLSRRPRHQPSRLRAAYEKDRPLVWFASGAAATALEPGLALFWLTWWLTFMENFEPGLWPLLLIALAVLVGDFTVFKFYEKLASFVSKRTFAGKNFDPHVWSLRLLYGVFFLIAADLLWQLRQLGKA